MSGHPVKSRIVRGMPHLQAALLNLVANSVWFEVVPEPFDRYRIKVKPESEHLLPAAKNWHRDATDDELLEYAREQLGDEFGDHDNGDARFVEGAKVVRRDSDDPAGFVVLTEVWIDYPRNTA